MPTLIIFTFLKIPFASYNKTPMQKPPGGGFAGNTSGQLTLGELLATTRLAQTDLLAFHFTRITSHQTGILQYGLERSVIVKQRPCNTVTHRTSLTCFATTGYVDHNVEFCQGLGQRQRLAHDHAAGFAGEEHIDRLVVYDNITLARLDKHASHRTLAATGSIVVIHAHD